MPGSRIPIVEEEQLREHRPAPLGQGLAQRDADILDRVVVVDMDVAIGLDGQVDQ